MKPYLSALLVLALAGSASAQDLTLPAPHKTGGMPLMEAFAKRSSARAYDARELSDQQLGDLLWAAWGVNRADGKRTAPSANNRQENEVYVLLRKGAYAYDAAKHALRLVAAEDLRPLVKGVEAPVILLYVADLAKRGPSGDARKNVAAVDTGFIGQNVYLYCASEGLATVYRGGGDRTALATALKLAADQTIIALQPVGFPRR
ncbi:SagB/ThcOx family dehydrogenase [Opitutus sp. ER46]|uniref:nitroreductase family protein n=1 Tax=Opitutus sp. ER46 TaxID=2161864 RepID=UPI000D30776C|nr:SagB/ThcOx family dehydrogenase [Opitutus sp. ER46]PTX90782.1 hypothetical protein DB354_19185 [Opitutus sp. ER46]